MMLNVALWVAAAGAVCQLAGQTAAPTESRISFEVASIKPHPGTVNFSSDPSVSCTRVTATASTLLDLITAADDVRYDRVSGGPNWVGSDHYDLAAKAEGEAPITKAQFRQMLQSLLADRFRLNLHRETREVPAFSLSVDKSGPKLKESSPNEPGKSFVVGSAAGIHMEAAMGTMEQLARQLSNTAGRPVVDKTGLAGKYAFKLDWMPADRPPGPDSDTPDIFSAVREQLGLRLEPTKTPVEMLIIDQAEKPSGN